MILSLLTEKKKMHKIVNQIRDLELIEKELSSNPVGVLAIMIDSEKVAQIATTFIYQDKNVFIFLESDNELYDKIQFDTNVTFTILKYGKLKRTKDMEFEPTYNLFSISISGIIKKIDEVKLFEELQKKYITKYKKVAGGEVDLSILHRVVIIDSEEIQAFEETGG